MSFDPQSTYVPTCFISGQDIDECTGSECFEWPEDPASTMQLALESILRWTDRDANQDTLDAIHSVARAALDCAT